VHALLQFCDMRRPWRLARFTLVGLSTYAETAGLLMFPVLTIPSCNWLADLLTKRCRHGASFLLLVPMAIATVGLSPRTSAAMWN
jgi:hypothetical protein